MCSANVSKTRAKNSRMLEKYSEIDVSLAEHRKELCQSDKATVPVTNADDSEITDNPVFSLFGINF